MFNVHDGIREDVVIDENKLKSERRNRF